ncbi:MAG: hypothetical protein JSR97_02900 [Verrucomicrobia bacterium]|nr:hypothetical protein [Verrucomicrobiota bacterium]
MTTTQLLHQLQSYLNQQGDLDQLIEVSCQAPKQTCEEVVNILLSWLKQEVIAKKEEDDFDRALGWLSQLTGMTIQSLIMQSHLCQQFAFSTKKAIYLDRAMTCLQEGFRLEPATFDQFQFWATLLVTKGRWQDDMTCVEQAIEMYARAKVRCGLSFELLWDQAVAWQLLYDFSIERSDLQKALNFFSRAQKFTKKVSPYFFVDYSKALHQLALATGDPAPIRQSLVNLRQIQPLVTSLPHVEKIVRELLIHAQSQLVLLTDDPTEFEHANRLYEETITAHPSLANLWLHWGYLLLQVGWKKQQVAIVETAVEKLTSLKIAEADPVLSTVFLSQALMALGVLVDDLNLIQEGEERLLKISQLCPEHRNLIKTEAFVCLAKALYFNDAQYFEGAVNRYTKLVTERGDDIESWYGLMEAYLGWGKLQKQAKLIIKSCHAAARLTQLRPFSSIYHIQTAQLLFLRYRFQQDMKNLGRMLEQAIKHLQLALAIKEDFEVLLQLALMWDALAEETGDDNSYMNAIQGLEILYLRLPTDYRLKNALGVALTHYGVYTLKPDLLFRASHLFEQVLKRDIEHASSLTHLGLCKLVLSEIAVDPHNPEEALSKRSDAERLLKQAIRYGDEEACFHLARLYSMKKLYSESIEYLKRARMQHVLPSIERLEQDTWLEGVRQTEAFQEFVSGLRGK